MSKLTHIGRYEIDKRLGSSDFGTAYLCRDLEMESVVVVKVFASDCRVAGYAQEIWRLRFLFEARILSNLEHPNIIRCKGFGRLEDQTPYFVMPYMPSNVKALTGSDQRDPERIAKLRKERKPKALPYDLAMDVLNQSLRGLAFLHERGMVHRDIKPSNLLLSQEKHGTVKISDFGLVKQPELNLTRTRGWIGTEDYIAPEQRKCAKTADARADVYAIARTAYRMLAGKLPDAVPQPLHLAVKEVPQPVSELIMMGMSAERDDRPKDAGVMLELLKEVIKAAS